MTKLSAVRITELTFATYNRAYEKAIEDHKDVMDSTESSPAGYELALESRRAVDKARQGLLAARSAVLSAAWNLGTLSHEARLGEAVAAMYERVVSGGSIEASDPSA